MEQMGSGVGSNHVDPAWTPLNKPRIRQITGIRIHQLTLPESLLYADKLVPDPPISEPLEGYKLGEVSHLLSSSPDTIGEHVNKCHCSSSHVQPGSSRPRRPSDASAIRERERSSSRSFISPSAAPPSRIRTARPRAPTLAGEVLEGHASLGPGKGLGHLHGSVDERNLAVEVKRRRLARCFVVLNIPRGRGKERPLDVLATGDGVPKGEIQPPVKRANGDVCTSAIGKSSARSSEQPRPALLRDSTTQSVPLPSTTPQKARTPGLARTSSRSSLNGPASTTTSTSPSTSRDRTTSLTSATFRSTATSQNPLPDGDTKPALTRTASRPRIVRPNSLVRSGSDHGIARRSGLSSTQGSLRNVAASKARTPNMESSASLPNGFFPPSNSSTTKQSTTLKIPPEASIPFYVSPIHRPSTHPRWLDLSLETDFAPWLAVRDAASSDFELEVWYEDSETGWRRLPQAGGGVDLELLRKVELDNDLAENVLELTLADTAGVWYLPRVGDVQGADGLLDELEEESAEERDRGRKGDGAKGVVERSLRETRMKKGIGVGALHQLVNIQAVIADTERGIAEVQRKIDSLLKQDVDGRCLRREVNEREFRVGWIGERILEVEKAAREVEARITLRRKAANERSACLVRTEEADDLLAGRILELALAIDTAEAERASLRAPIHAIRAFHVQNLDFIFPVSSLLPSRLLYAILDVPLPIPSGAKDPAPPLTPPAAALPEHVKVDERSTAAALGYVAMVVQILGHLSGAAGGVPYPVTCAGSRSLVKDVVSVMQGPRAFPLFAKGVESYRYEYAVFLLNKNIEALMQQANVRALDIRHTLPNLKALLLTLSSPVPPAPVPSFTSAGSTTYVDSLGSSRQTSRAWSAKGLMSPGPDQSQTELSGPTPADSFTRRESRSEDSPAPSPSPSSARAGQPERVGWEPDPRNMRGSGRRSRLSRSSVVDAAVESEQKQIGQSEEQLDHRASYAEDQAASISESGM